jgi:thiol-disulfide isomerase/thioredoxin
LIDAPQVLTAEEAPAGGGFFFASPGPRTDLVPSVAGPADDAARTAMEDLERIDQDLAKASAPADQAKLHAKRADLLERLIGTTTRPEERSVWIRQYADTVSAAAQSGAYPEGVQRLDKLVESLQKEGGDKNLIAFVLYRSMEADYSVSLQKPDADYAKIQEKWLTDLEAFVKIYSASAESAEAMIHLALADEFSEKEDQAKARYEQIVRSFPESLEAKKAAGALRRLDCVGKSISLRGTTISGTAFDLSRSLGKYTVIQYWATWCEPCTQDMKTLQTLLQQYGARGLTVVGVNLDAERKDAELYVQRSRIPWPQLYEPGGLHSRYALEMGVLTLPVMLLVDAQGRVISRSLHISQLEEELKKGLR